MTETQIIYLGQTFWAGHLMAGMLRAGRLRFYGV